MRIAVLVARSLRSSSSSHCYNSNTRALSGARDSPTDAPSGARSPFKWTEWSTSSNSGNGWQAIDGPSVRDAQVQCGARVLQHLHVLVARPAFSAVDASTRVSCAQCATFWRRPAGFSSAFGRVSSECSRSSCRRFNVTARALRSLHSPFLYTLER